MTDWGTFFSFMGQLTIIFIFAALVVGITMGLIVAFRDSNKTDED